AQLEDLAGLDSPRLAAVMPASLARRRLQAIGLVEERGGDRGGLVGRHRTAELGEEPAARALAPDVAVAHVSARFHGRAAATRRGRRRARRGIADLEPVEAARILTLAEPVHG